VLLAQLTVIILLSEVSDLSVGHGGIGNPVVLFTRV